MSIISIEHFLSAYILDRANGYLIDQFISEVTNKRTDDYGGSIENRARFALEVIDAVTKRIGEERTAIRFSPFSEFQGTSCAVTFDLN